MAAGYEIYGIVKEILCAQQKHAIVKQSI